MQKVLSVVLMLGILLMPRMGLAQELKQVSEQKQIQLNESQKKELSSVYEQYRKIKLQLLDKYHDFGVLDDQEWDNHKKRVEKKFEAIKKNGYLPICYHCRDKEKHHHHKH
jgi:flagellar basal body-associated protein FliL